MALFQSTYDIRGRAYYLVGGLAAEVHKVREFRNSLSLVS